MKMQNTEMEFVAFDAQDIIATSGDNSFDFSGFYDGVSGNIDVTYSYEGKSGTVENIYGNLELFKNTMKTVLGVDTAPTMIASKQPTGTQCVEFSNLYGPDMINNSAKADIFNGVYQWVSENGGYFLHQ